MSMVSKALHELLNEKNNTTLDTEVINIEVSLEPDLEEDMLSGIRGDVYDEQSLSEWYDFADNVENIAYNFGEVVEVSMSDVPNSLSEYISFYPYDKDGNLKHYIFNLRISDHPITKDGRDKRKKEIQKFSSKWKVEAVTVNERTFNSYSEALRHIRKLLADDLMND